MASPRASSRRQELASAHPPPLGLSRPPPAYSTTSAPSSQDSRSPPGRPATGSPCGAASLRPEVGARGGAAEAAADGWLHGVCSVFSGWDGFHVVRLAAVPGEDAVSCGWSGRCGEGRGPRAPHHSPGTRRPSRDRFLPEAAGTSQLFTPLPPVTLAGCEVGLQGTFGLIWRLCWGYYKGGGAGTIGI